MTYSTFLEPCNTASHFVVSHDGLDIHATTPFAIAKNNILNIIQANKNQRLNFGRMFFLSYYNHNIM
ncbi:hypothetical protein [Rickettsia endosymbiont of Polydrusus tereticollis]|uniref:hypothetical protein n=1 Tax=Rickettsia endosymbiont of Polydrusus tereticollis TaxID=3066251 RepID=UPI003132C59D